MSLTYQKEISFISPTFFDPEKGQMGGFEEKEITKTATFKELSRTDREQHELHFMIMAAFEETKGKKVKYDSSQVLQMTDIYIETCMLVNDGTNPTIDITASDKLQFLNDSIAKLNFGLWLLNEKFAPFFSQLGKR
jgi:hypothetical protein